MMPLTQMNPRNGMQWEYKVKLKSFWPSMP